MAHLACLGPHIIDRVLNDVERRRLLIQPTGEGPVPFARIAGEHLNKGTGILLGLPRGGGFAGAQLHHDVADAHALAGFERQVAPQPAALVEQPNRCHALRHWRRALVHRRWSRLRLGLGRGFGFGVCLLRWRDRILDGGHGLPRAYREDDRAKRQGEPAPHALPGLHAS
jgi:hypothetical protein